MSMSELHKPEWYGEYAVIKNKYNDYVQVEYKCNGTGSLYDYDLFPGIDLIFMDFNCSDIFHEPIPNKNIIEIRHYQKGRVEFELRNNKVFHMKEGEFCINALANIPAAYSFPFGYSVGLSCVIDKDSVDVQTQQFFSYYNIDVLNLGRELELEKNWFLCRTPQRLLHIFDELYAAKGIEGRDYFRIKLLELFYHIKQLRIEDQYEATYYAKEQIEIIKRIRQKNTYRRTLTKRANEQSHISGYFQTDLWRNPLCAYQKLQNESCSCLFAGNRSIYHANSW